MSENNDSLDSIITVSVELPAESLAILEHYIDERG